MTVVPVAGGEEIRVGAKRNLPAILFLPLWLSVWTVGMAVGVAQLAEDFAPAPLLWLALLTVIWLLVGALLGWYLAGSTVLRVEGGDLEIGARLLGITRTRRYRASEVSGLTVAASPPYHVGRTAGPFPGEGCRIRFNYGTRTVHAATGRDEAEAHLILERLRKRLPRSIADGSGTEERVARNRG